MPEFLSAREFDSLVRTSQAAIGAGTPIAMADVNAPDKNITDAASLFKAKSKHPGLCMTCKGEGCVSDPEEFEIDEEEVIWLCPDCLGKLKCPKCGQKLPKGSKKKLEEFIEGGTDAAKCRHCDWEDGDPAILQHPEK